MKESEQGGNRGHGFLLIPYRKGKDTETAIIGFLVAPTFIQEILEILTRSRQEELRKTSEADGISSHIHIDEEAETVFIRQEVGVTSPQTINEAASKLKRWLEDVGVKAIKISLSQGDVQRLLTP